MLLLFQKQYEDDSFELSPIITSKYDWKIEDFLCDLLKDSVEYDARLQKYADECKDIIKSYLLNNYNAITGWRDIREQVGTSYPITDKEKDNVIEFLCNNYSYSHGKNIIEVPYNNGFIDKYCDIKKLSKPYPKLTKPPNPPIPYYKKEWFCIKDIECLEG